MLRRFSVLLLTLLLIVPVIAQDTMLESNLVDECVTDYDASVDYFPDKAEVKYAENFTVEYFSNYKVVTVVPFANAEETRTYILVQCGTEVPDDIEADAIVEAPVQRIVALSTTILPHIVDQELVDRLVAVDSLAFTSTQEILDNAESIAEVNPDFAGLNLEVLLDIEPDVIMGQQFFATDGSFDASIDAGLAVVLNSDFADTSPLAAAEWGKYLSLYFNTEAIANETFETVETEYNDLVELVADVEARPTVLAGTPFEGNWFLAGGASTISQLITDAGGDYLFSDLEGTSLQLSFEEVLDQAIDADYWINLNQPWTTTDEMLSADERYAEFAAFEVGNLWNNNLQQLASGGNGYFESGFVNPQLILGDLVAILHPDLLPEHEFSYYQQLES
ncbi:MAG: ABC transporter substrate-binding protein [Chloroflexota bacterium]